jgi:hypothetical protein
MIPIRSSESVFYADGFGDKDKNKADIKKNIT